MPLCGSCVDACSSALLFSAILGCRRTELPLIPLSEFAEPALKRGHIWLLGCGIGFWAGVPTLAPCSGGQEQSTTCGFSCCAIQLPNPAPIRERLRQIRTLPDRAQPRSLAGPVLFLEVRSSHLLPVANPNSVLFVVLNLLLAALRCGNRQIRPPSKRVSQCN